MSPITPLKLNTIRNSHQSIPPPKRRWLTRYVLPLTLFLLLALILIYSARDVVIPAQQVITVRAIAHESSNVRGAIVKHDTVSVQAPGWVEPDPFLIHVSSLTNGIIKNVYVFDGDKIESGQIVADLVDDDAQLEVSSAEAELARCQVELQAARNHWDNPVQLKFKVEASKARLSETREDLARLESVIVQKRHTLSELEVVYEKLSTLSPKATAALELERSKYQMEAQRANLTATEKEREVLKARIQYAEAELTATESDFQLRINDRRRLEIADAQAQAAVVALEQARLRLKRTKIISPTSGIVMKVLATPGSRVMMEMDSPHAAHVVHLYDPEKLQVRVDVPLQEAGKIYHGQFAEIIVDVLPDQSFKGQVIRFVHKADISKNTVQVKVSIDEPSPLLKPDMLARIKFFGRQQQNSVNASEGSGVSVFIPEQAVDSSKGTDSVWLVEGLPERVRQQTVTLGTSKNDGWIEVISGVKIGAILVESPSPDLQSGDRVRSQNNLNKPH